MAKDNNAAEAASVKEPVAHSVSSRQGHQPTPSIRKFVAEYYAHKAATRRRVPASRVRAGILALAFVAVAVLGGIGGGYLESHNRTTIIGGTLSSQKRIVSSQSQLINQIAKTTSPSVVSVNVNITTAASSDNPFSFFSGGGASQQTAAAGTGIIISDDGIIMTNRHVVPEGTDKVSVTLSDGTELDNVSVIGRTSASDSLDIAFLKIADTEGHKLTAASIGNSSTVETGDDVVAIGNALGEFQNTVTAGIVSGFGRSVQASSGGSDSYYGSGSDDTESLNNLIQTDAAINEGNSGGPLVNLNGQVIGINTAIAGNAQNIGFAIPINDVKGLISQVLKSGKFERPYLGVRYVLLDAQAAKEYKLNVKVGAYIAPSTDPTQPAVVAGSPAAAAGLQEGDIITKIGSSSIDSKNNLVSLLGQYKPGDSISLTLIRDGKTITKQVTLAAVPTS
ncbi:MAG: putative HtrA2 peptidase [Candidatus Saccharibacteria bacterium]|nr:putative HtrA2 peptidase [Candidatus Saccharibacteria bacterium]